MKPKHNLRPFLALAGSSLLAVSFASAQSTLYWDGADSGANAQGGAGTWTTTTPTNWDSLAIGGADSGWTSGDRAVFGGTAGTVTIGTGGVTTSGITFNTTAYVLNAGTNGLTFSSGNNAVSNTMTSSTTATITGLVSGTGANLSFSSPQVSTSTLTFNGISAGGWTGTTTIGAGMTLATTTTSGNVNQVLNNTSGITLNGGGAIQFNRATNAQLNAISDSAAITVNGGGTFSANSGDAGGASANETIGAVTLNSGQFNLNWANNPSSGGNIILSGLTRSGSTSALTVSFGANGRFINSAVSTNTAANEIIGPWATTGGAAGTAAQTDYAVYSGGNGTITARGIAASAQSTWSTAHAATSNFTLNTTNVTANVNGRLTANRNINTLRNLTGATAPSAVDATTEYITMAGNDFQNGDVVVSRNTVGGQLVQGQAYYVINKDGAGAGTFQVSATPGGSAVNLTTTATGFISGGLSLNGNVLGTYGILNGSSDPMAIGRSGGGSITLPVANVNNNLYVTNGNASIWIDAPITDNGTGKLTLVKGGTSGNGSGNVMLSGTNTYTGGTVINSGTLAYTSDAALGASGSRNITFGGTASLTWGFDGSSLNTLTVGSGAVGTLTSLNNITFATTTGSGTIRASGGQNKFVDLGNASAFTGDVALAYNANNNSGPNTAHVRFSSLNDAAGSSIQFFRQGGGSDSGQVGQIGLTGDAGSVTFNNRQIQLLPRSGGSGQSMATNWLLNNNATPANNWVINTNLLNQYDRSATLGLGGTNIGDNAFNGSIGDSTFSGAYSSGTGALSVRKEDAGVWSLSGSSSYTGSTTIVAGTLVVSSLADGGSNSSIGASTNAAGNLVLNGGTLRYTGGAASSDRLFSLQASSTINSSGTGALNLTNTGSMGFNGGTAAKTLTLTGTNTGNNTIAAAIGNNTGATAITKSGIGTWVLSGANTNTGNTTLSDGGTLILDYGTQDNNKIAGVLNLNAGTITLNGGTHEEAVTSTTMSAAGGHTSIGLSGGRTAAINLGAITRSFSVNSAGATLSFASDNIGKTSSSNNTAGILGGWATVGSHWATVSGGSIVALGSYATFATSGTSLTSNYQLTGSSALTGNLTASTLRISSSADGQSLDLGASRTLALGQQSTSVAGGLMYTGGGTNNTYTITGTGTSRIQNSNGNQETLFHIHTGTLIADVLVGNGGGPVTKTGVGTLVLKKANDYTGATYVNQGVLRMENNNSLGAVSSGASSTFVFNGAALEITNGISAGAEALTLTGSGASSGGALRNVAGSTSSYAGAITIGNGGARINSDASGALTLTGGVVTSRFNDVTIGGAGNTTVSTTAISGAGGLVKDGTGTVTLSATNTYTGATNVSQGALAVSGTGSINNTSGITIASGAEFKYNSSTALTVGITNNGGKVTGSGNLGAIVLGGTGSIDPGNSPGIMTAGSTDPSSGLDYNFEFTVETLAPTWSNATASGNDVLRLTDGTDPFASALDGDNVVSIYLPSSFTVGDTVIGGFFTDLNSDFLLTVQNANFQYFIQNPSGPFSYNSQNYASYGGLITVDTIQIGTADFAGGDVTNGWSTQFTAVVPEPGAALLGGIGTLLLLRRRRQG